MITGFTTLAAIIGCLLFWGVIIMFITHSTLLAIILKYVFITFAVMAFIAIILHIAKLFYKNFTEQDQTGNNSTHKDQ